MPDEPQPPVAPAAPDEGVPAERGPTVGGRSRAKAPKHDAGHDPGLVLLGGLLAIIGGVCAQYFQAQYQREQAGIELRIQEQRDARSALEEISDRLDEPIARGLMLHQAQTSGAPDSVIRARRAAYQAAIDEWHVRYSRTRVLAAIYFGTEVASDIEDFHGRLAFLDETLKDHETRVAEAARIQRRLRDLPDERRIALAAAMRESLAEVDSAGEAMIRSLRESAYTRQRLWAALVQARRVGSFDPLGSLMITPRQEREMAEDYRRDAAKADSISRVGDSLGRSRTGS